MEPLQYSIGITINLDAYDEKVRKHCEDNPYDAPEYTTLIQRIATDLEQLDGVEQVMFDHMSWISFDLGIDDFSEAAFETAVVMKEITEVFAKHGVK